jgi:uncharacterized membrane protein
MSMTLFVRARLCLLALALGLVLTHSHAQSTYVVSTLKPASAEGLRAYAAAWSVDAADNVVSSAGYASAYSYDLFKSKFVPIYRPYVVRWAANGTATVAASKLYASGDLLDAASPNGQLLMFSTSRLLYDTVARKSLGKLPVDAYSGRVSAVSNQGVAVFNQFERSPPNLPLMDTTRAKTWSVSKGVQSLDDKGFYGAWAQSVNAAGVVVGAVVVSETKMNQAALWVNGQLQLLPQPANSASMAFDINDKGQALVRRAQIRSCPASNNLPAVPICGVGPSTVYLREGGVENALLAPGDERGIVSAHINLAGVVVGRYRVAANRLDSNVWPQENASIVAKDGRAFIWQKGVFSDLTAYVSSQGVALPAGAVLTDAMAISDKGSLVVQAVLADGSEAYLRLLAKP